MTDCSMLNGDKLELERLINSKIAKIAEFSKSCNPDSQDLEGIIFQC